MRISLNSYFLIYFFLIQVTFWIKNDENWERPSHEMHIGTVNRNYLCHFYNKKKPPCPNPTPVFFLILILFFARRRSINLLTRYLICFLLIFQICVFSFSFFAILSLPPFFFSPDCTDIIVYSRVRWSVESYPQRDASLTKKVGFC